MEYLTNRSSQQLLRIRDEDMVSMVSNVPVLLESTLLYKP